MHILYIHQYFATAGGSTGTRSYEFSRRWVQAGHRVTMLTSIAQLTDADLTHAERGRLTTRFAIDGIEVIAVNVRYRQAMGFASRLLAFVKFMAASTVFALVIPRVDVVFATSTPLTVGVPALAARWVRGRPYVFEVRDVWPEVPIAMGILRNPIAIRVATWLERLIYRFASAIVALSPGMASSVRKHAPTGTEIVTVPNASDTELFSPRVDGEAMRRSLGWRDRFVCVHTGAMGRANGLDSILNAARQLPHDDLLFAVIGEGGEKDRLRETQSRLGLNNLFIGNGIPKVKMPAVLAAADVGLVTFAPIPVLEHNSANKFFDYLAAGKPILLNYSGWQRELLEDAGAGLGCTMGDDDEFIRKIAELKADPERRKRMGENARRLAEERFSRDRLAQKALDVVVAVGSRRRR